MYTKISYKELNKYRLENRIAFTISWFKTNDLDEYVINVGLYLRNIGLDTNKFLKTRIIENEKHEYMIVYILRNGVTLTQKEINIIDNKAFAGDIISVERIYK